MCCPVRQVKDWEEWLSQHTLDELNALNQVAKEHF